MGTIEGKNAILTLEKSAFNFDPSKLSDFRSLSIDKVQKIDHNDVYYWNLATLAQDLDNHPGAKINMIYPATETHIKKYEVSTSRYVIETPEFYEKYVAPYIATMRGDRIKWVRQILHEGVEAERVLVRVDDDPSGRRGNFVLLPDLKWDRKNMETLYLVAILVSDEIASIRDLKASHIPMLKSIREKIVQTVKQNFGLDSSQLKIYVHYQPSYYHFHIHVTHVSLDRHDFGRSIFLDQIIQQLETMDSEGYSKATLSYLINDKHDLWVNGFSLQEQN